MAKERAQRRLAAILAADVVGFSRLMGLDEAGTLARLRALRGELVDPKIAEHSGRIFKATGDGILAEFPSVVDAVACAVDIQNGVERLSEDTLEEQALRFRIGINLGDLIVEGEDVFGDGVNVAVRLEGLAQPGEVAVSSTVRDHVGTRLDFQFEDMGEHGLKNIDRPVRVFRVLSDGRQPSSHRPALTLPDKPSIAVLPFTNISGDQEQQYLSDGITEDIITELSRFHSLLVIARNSSFHFRGPAVDIAEVRRKLGVQYIVEGSLRKLGNTVRITAQLIDATTGAHLWAERYDRDLKDIFMLQDEVIATIAATVEGRAATTAVAQVRRKPLKNWAAYDFYLQGREHVTQYKNNEAEPLFARSIELDPTFAQAHAWQAMTLVGKYWYDDNPETLKVAKAFAEKAVLLDPSDALGHNAVGLALLHMHHHAEAGNHFDRARSLNPIDVTVLGDHANWLNLGGRPQEALQVFEMVVLRDPLPPIWLWEVKGTALYLLKRYPEAISAYRKAGSEHYFIHAFLAAAYALDGQLDAAQSEVAQALKILPNLTISGMIGGAGFPFADRPSLDHFLTGFRLAGFPE